MIYLADTLYFDVIEESIVILLVRKNLSEVNVEMLSKNARVPKDKIQSLIHLVIFWSRLYLLRIGRKTISHINTSI